MPHLRLEYTDNVIDMVDVPALFGALHAAMVELEVCPLLDVKSRAVRLQSYHIADGEPQRAMVHLDLSLLAGRDISMRQRLVQACMRILAQHFERSSAALDCQLSVEVREMERATYGKQRSGAG